VHEKMIAEDQNTDAPQNWIEKIKRYKTRLSIGVAIAVVLVGALSHYKNERVKEKLAQAIAEYQKKLLLIGGEIDYENLECSGIIATDCTLKGIKFSMLGQEQLSIASLRLGDVAELSKIKELPNGKRVKAAIDIDARQVILPRPLMAQMIAHNVSNAFQENTLSKLNAFDLTLQGELEGTSALMEHFEIERLRIDNAIMPIEFSMKADKIAAMNPDSMILQNFSLSLENRAVSDVTFESVKSFLATLSKEEQTLLLKEFSLTPADMEDKEKASEAINTAIAKRFEGDLALTQGIVEKELIRAIIKMLKGDADAITLQGENKNNLSLGQIQNALANTATMSDESAQKFMEDKFDIAVKTN